MHGDDGTEGIRYATCCQDVGTMELYPLAGSWSQVLHLALWNPEPVCTEDAILLQTWSISSTVVFTYLLAFPQSYRPGS